MLLLCMLPHFSMHTQNKKYQFNSIVVINVAVETKPISFHFSVCGRSHLFYHFIKSRHTTPSSKKRISMAHTALIYSTFYDAIRCNGVVCIVPHWLSECHHGQVSQFCFVFLIFPFLRTFRYGERENH